MAMSCAWASRSEALDDLRRQWQVGVRASEDRTEEHHAAIAKLGRQVADGMAARPTQVRDLADADSTVSCRDTARAGRE